MTKPYRQLASALFSLLLFSQVTTADTVAKVASPNIIIVVADDLGWNDVGFHGGDIDTPRWINWPMRVLVSIVFTPHRSAHPPELH